MSALGSSGVNATTFDAERPCPDSDTDVEYAVELLYDPELDPALVSFRCGGCALIHEELLPDN